MTKCVTCSHAITLEEAYKRGLTSLRPKRGHAEMLYVMYCNLDKVFRDDDQSCMKWESFLTHYKYEA